MTRATPAGTSSSSTGPTNCSSAGDHVLPHITPSIGLEATAGTGLPLADYMASLLDVLALRGRLISKDVDGIDTFEPARY
jgi:hypothetical protein